MIIMRPICLPGPTWKWANSGCENLYSVQPYRFHHHIIIVVVVVDAVAVQSFIFPILGRHMFVPLHVEAIIHRMYVCARHANVYRLLYDVIASGECNAFTPSWKL